MKCPHCPETTLVMADKQGVEIDYCPACRGIWLDRGELDKLLERASAAVAPAQLVAQSQKPPNFEDSDYRGGQRYQRNRKKSWLDEIFD
jgi:Zn-finger nucleic acid-binding protein